MVKYSGKIIKKLIKISLIVLLVIITVPAIGLLFIQNKQVQTSISNYVAEQLSRNLDAEISLSSIKYSFFKRLYVYDLLIEDQRGDTLIYSEYTRIRFKKFKPDKQNIHIRSISLDNVYFHIHSYGKGDANLNFITNRLKSDLPPDERIILKIDFIEAFNSHFIQTVDAAKSPPYGIDFSELDIDNLNARVENVLSRMDTLSMDIVEGNGIEKSGFILEGVNFGLTLSKNFMTFEDGYLTTPSSTASIPLVDFRFNDYQDFQEIYDSVYTTIISEGSYMALSDLAYFFHQLKNMNGDIYLDGNVYGTFGNLIGKGIDIKYLANSKLNFDMILSGLPNADSLYMEFDFREFKSDMSTMEVLTSNYNFALFNDTTLTENIGRFNYSGKFSGYANDFETSGRLATDLGTILFDLNMKPDTNRFLKYKGSLKTSNFRIGELIDKQDIIENVTLNINVDGINKNGEFDISVSGQVDSVGINKYNYRNIKLAGDFTNRGFDGSFSIKDPNIDMLFAGKVDFEEEIPQFNFTLDVANLRPYYLHLRNDDPEYFASFFLKTDLSGIQLNNLNGEIQLVNSFFKRTGLQVQIYDLLLSTENTADTSYIALRSELLDANIYGDYQVTNLPNAFKSIINSHLALFPTQSYSHDTASRFAYEILFKETNPILEFFFPKFKIANGSSISGYYRPLPNMYNFALNGSMPHFEYNGYQWDNLVLRSKSDTNNLNVKLISDKLYTSAGFEVMQPVINLNLYNNHTNLTVNWDNQDQPGYAGNIETEGFLIHNIPGEFTYELSVLPSLITYNDRQFNIPSSKIHIDQNSFEFDSLMIYGFDQYIIANGKYSNSPDDQINISLNNINISSLNNISDKINFDLKGEVSGEAMIKKDNQKPVLASNLFIDSLYINDQLLGNTHAVANWIEENKEISMVVTSFRDSIKTIDISGTYQPGSGEVDYSVNLNQIQFMSLKPYISDYLDDLEGTIGVKADLQGFLTEPILIGRIFFENTAFKIIETQTSYKVTDEVKIYMNNFFFKDFLIRDIYDNQLFVNGNITSSNLRNYSLNLDLNATNFDFLNTRRIDNEQFYGDIFASGIVSLRGPINQLAITASAKTEKNTNLNLPLYNAAQIQTTDFITFKRVLDEEIEEPETFSGQVKGITLDLDLDIESGANVQLIFDPKVGDIIEASGRGNIKIKIDEDGEFTMFGDVLIQDGDYLFTLQNVINKKFTVKPGGNIVWNGSPTEAIIDLQAIYELKAAPYNLSLDADPVLKEKLKKRIPVHCLISLQGDLSNPEIYPSIDLPTAEPETRSLLENNIGTDEELMRQFISLLVINNFMSVNGLGTDVASGLSTGGLAAGVTASTELLSNQLSNWLSQISNDFDIGVNYRPGDISSDNLTSDEVEVALSTQLFDDRIILSGNLDVGVNQKTGTANSNIVGEFNLEFRVTDKISLKAFNRANDDLILRDAPYTQGVGLQYRNEFDSLSELFERKKSKKEKNNTSGIPEQDELLIREEE